ncbi:MAG TPA: hypothetical protein VII94_03845 [Candidatus Saccharimonadales bacterium]
MFLYYQWLGDHRDDADLTKNHAYLLGSFWNPQAVQDMLNPNIHESSDEDVAESMKIIEENDVRAPKIPLKSEAKRRKRRTILKEKQG